MSRERLKAEFEPATGKDVSALSVDASPGGGHGPCSPTMRTTASRAAS